MIACDLRELVHPAARQHRSIVSPQIPLFTIHASVESPLCDVTLHHTHSNALPEVEEPEATLTCYISAKTYIKNLKLYFLSCMQLELSISNIKEF